MNQIMLHAYQESTIEVLKMSLYVANEFNSVKYLKLLVGLDLLALVAIHFVYLCDTK